MRYVVLGFIVCSSSLFGMGGGVDVQVSGGEGGYYDDDGYYYDNRSVWYGPGFYWGTWYDNEDDFRRWNGHRHWHNHDGSRHYHHGGHHYHHGGGGHHH